MREEEKGTIKSNDGNWYERQVSGSYDDAIGQMQNNTVLALTFLMEGFFLCGFFFLLQRQEFVYCIVTLWLLCPNFKEVLWNLKGNKQK